MREIPSVVLNFTRRTVKCIWDLWDNLWDFRLVNISLALWSLFRKDISPLKSGSSAISPKKTSRQNLRCTPRKTESWATSLRTEILPRQTSIGSCWQSLGWGCRVLQSCWFSAPCFVSKLGRNVELFSFWLSSCTGGRKIFCQTVKNFVSDSSLHTNTEITNIRSVYALMIQSHRFISFPLLAFVISEQTNNFLFWLLDWTQRKITTEPSE